MNAASLVNPTAGLGPAPNAARTVQLRRDVRLVRNICRQWLFSAFRASHLDRARWDAALRRLCGGTLRALDIELEISGPMPPALAPMLMVANHISWLDSFALNSLRPCRYLSKSEVSSMAIYGTIVKHGGRGIFIVRDSARDLLRAKDAVASVLRDGYRVGFFAEATSTDGRRLGTFHSALLQAAIDTSTLIQPLAISYYTAEGIPTTSPAFWGDMTMAQSLAAIIRAPSIVARLDFCEPIDPASGRRRELADEARSRIARKLNLVADEPAHQRLDPQAETIH